MRLRELMITALLGALVIIGATPASANGGGGTDNTNSPEYWETVISNDIGGGNVSCYKDSHGRVVDNGMAVSLSPFDPNWEGTGYVALIVKGGSAGEDGAGNKVYMFPNAGTSYKPPLNAGGQQAAVSHWIVCKGDVPVDYEVTCEAVTITYPQGIDSIDVNIKWTALPGGSQQTQNYHPNVGATDGQVVTVNIAATGYYSVDWVQVNGTNYHWQEGLVCGQPDIPEQPQDKVERTEWSVSDYDCDAQSVTETREVTTTTYTWDAQEWEWVAAAPTTTTETRDRDMTAGERVEYCPPPEQPKDKVERTEWGVESTSCEAQAVTETREVTTTTYTWDAEAWEWVGSSSTTTETRDRDMTDDERLEHCATTPAAPLWTDQCGFDNAYWTLPDDTEHVTYTQSTWHGYLVVTATAQDGYVFPNGETVMTWKDKDSNEPCVLDTPDAPTWTDACGFDNAYWTLPEDTEHYSYAAYGYEGKLAVVATAAEGYVFPGGESTMVWEDTDSNEPCVDAAASVSVKPASCDADGSVGTVLTTNAIAPESLPSTPGEHTVTFVAEPGHVFPGGSSELDVTYTIASQLTEGCGGVLPGEVTLDGTIVTEYCSADAPFLDYDVVLNDPDDLSTDDGTATITFVHPTDPAQNWSATVPIGSGRILWPGASLGANGKADGWPGWEYNEATEEWVSVGDGNFGWTRAADTTVLIEVNPSTTFTVNYPPATPNCNSAPPKEIVEVLGAPPATPVVAEAQYAG
ncbi:hypothetical protein Lsed01_01981 [Demequina sediminis]|uniref:Ig-like domain-containing protein n=1 Tax=Demequina sediminis TaxID=1930058 RepID=A0ABP9WIE4_9MICO|nr:hypothetical protein [Demequina sediminis]BDZ62063.1 hypothetical protein GCM10025873_18540 [Demequina sediminis]